MAVRWMWLILRRTKRPLGVRALAEVPAAFRKIRFVALLESGTHVLWSAHMDQYATAELTLAGKVVPALRQGMLCLADRFFPSYKLWRLATKTGAFALEARNGIVVRVIDYRLKDVPGAAPASMSR